MVIVLAVVVGRVVDGNWIGPSSLLVRSGGANAEFVGEATRRWEDVGLFCMAYAWQTLEVDTQTDPERATQ